MYTKSFRSSCYRVLELLLKDWHFSSFVLNDSGSFAALTKVALSLIGLSFVLVFLAQSMVEGTKGLLQLIKELRKTYHPMSAAR